jgi:hypothetical protein
MELKEALMIIIDDIGKSEKAYEIIQDIHNTLLRHNK